MGCRLYARFGNGLAYEFLPGETLTISSAKEAATFPKVAEAMAQMHQKVDLGPEVPKEPCMWKKLHMFLDQYPQDLTDSRLEKISKQGLQAEVDFLEENLKPILSKRHLT